MFQGSGPRVQALAHLSRSRLGPRLTCKAELDSDLGVKEGGTAVKKAHDRVQREDRLEQRHRRGFFLAGGLHKRKPVAPALVPLPGRTDRRKAHRPICRRAAQDTGLSGTPPSPPETRRGRQARGLPVLLWGRAHPKKVAKEWRDPRTASLGVFLDLYAANQEGEYRSGPGHGCAAISGGRGPPAVARAGRGLLHVRGQCWRGPGPQRPCQAARYAPSVLPVASGRVAVAARESDAHVAPSPVWCVRASCGSPARALTSGDLWQASAWQSCALH